MVHTRIIKLIRLFTEPPQLCNDKASEVLRSTMPSATLANVVQEHNQFFKHKDFTYIQPFNNLRGKYRSTGNLKCMKT